jgi:light-regulated signal transduction histidine kinase (bacteriophytochrome)
MVQGDQEGIQPCAYLLELSFDWLVLRASENVHHLLGESHVTLIDEPLGRFVHAQAIHDLRNLFSRLSGTTGIARAYRVRLTDDPDLFDIAFQQIEERVLLEAVPSPVEGFGEAFGSVGGLIESLDDSRGDALLEAAARHMRALTAYDRVTFLAGKSKATSSRSGVPFAAGANATLRAGLPLIVCDSNFTPVPIFPMDEPDAVAHAALLHMPSDEQKAELHERGFAATMRVPVMLDGKKIGEFRCAHLAPRQPNFELHAAAELFAQMFAMRLEMDRLRAA